MNFAFSQASLADIPRLLSLEADCFACDRFSRRQFAYLIRHGKCAIWVIRVSGVIAAYAIQLLPARLSHSRIYSIAVAHEWRGRGFGRALLKHMESCAVAKGYRSLSLEVRSDNASARKLYERFGFDPVGLTEAYYADGESAIRYRKQLDIPRPEGLPVF